MVFNIKKDGVPKAQSSPIDEWSVTTLPEDRAKVGTTGPKLVDVLEDEPLRVIPARGSSSLRRRRRSYSDPAYEWQFYRITGNQYDKIKILHRSELRNEKFLDSMYNKMVPRGKQDYYQLRRGGESQLDQARRLRSIFGIQPFLKTIGLNPVYLLEFIRDNTYAFKNILLHVYAWFFFYFTEYICVTLSLHFPSLDWFASVDLFVWPVHFEYYYIRSISGIYILAILVFLYFQLISKRSSYFDLSLGFSNFVVFWGSIFLYYQTGFAPFILFFTLSFVSFVLLNFFYFIPRVIVKIKVEPPALLAASESYDKFSGMLFLPKFCYRYPFLEFPGVAKLKKKNFTAFPFVTASIRRISVDYKLIRAVKLYSYLRVRNRYIPVRTKEPLVGGDFDAYCGFNSYDYLEVFFRGNPPVNRLSHPPTGETDELEEIFTRTQAYDGPLGISNSLFFSTNYRKATLSLYKKHFTSEYDTFDIHFGPRLPLWQSHLLKDPYFMLYIWLKHLSPRLVPPKSDFCKNYLFRSSVAITKDTPYPVFHKSLNFLYFSVERFFDRLTFYHFYKLPRLITAFDYYCQICFFSSRNSKVFYASNHVIKLMCKFFLSFESSLLSNPAFYEPIFKSELQRFELIHSISYILQEVRHRRSALNFRAESVNSRSLLLITLIRILNRVLLILTNRACFPAGCDGVGEYWHF